MDREKEDRMAIEPKRTKRHMVYGLVAGGMILGLALLLVGLSIIIVNIVTGIFGE